MAKLKVSDKLKGILGTVAPLLGTAAGGPLGGLVGTLIAEKLGVDSEAAAMAQLETNPDALVKLKEVETAFRQRMAELDIDEQRIAAEDRSSARDLAKGTSLIPQVSLSVLFVLGYFVVLGMFFSSTLEVPMSDAFMVMLGVLTGGVPQIMAFWLGSSSGSAKKTDIMAKNGEA